MTHHIAVSRRTALAGLGCLIAAPATAQVPITPSLDVPYVPTPQEVVDRMLEMAKVTAKDFVMDLGCGDGRMLVTAASRFGARGFGVDLNPVRIEEATANAQKAKVTDKVRFEVRNLFDTSIKDADVLTMYLLPSVNLQLRPRILDEMRPGSRIVSHAFHMGEWEADQRDRVEYSDIYFWVVPAKVGGRWTIADGADKIAIDVKQAFQMLDGSARRGAASGKVSGRVNGLEVRFTVETGGVSRLYAGRLDGERIVPIAAQGAAMGWTATRG